MANDYDGPDPANAFDAIWQPVSSSNVEAIRWVEGADYPLGVRFKPKGKSPGSEYEYATPRGVYDAMASAGSKGQFVWRELRDKYPYRKVA
jgi:hypothetical protein